MTNQKPLVLPHSERFLIARCTDSRNNPVEFGVTVSYTTARTSPVYDVLHETGNNETDVFYTTNAQEAVLVYNAIVQGEK